jgi:hypothetical protein
MCSSKVTGLENQKCHVCVIAKMLSGDRSQTLRLPAARELFGDYKTANECVANLRIGLIGLVVLGRSHVKILQGVVW